MSKSKYPGQYDSFVSNASAVDQFIAADSVAKRPNPSDIHADRPRTPNQVPPTVLEANLEDEGAEA